MVCLDDLGKEALIPALIASTTAYVAFVTLHGTEPLFSIARVTAQVNVSEIMISLVRKMLIGGFLTGLVAPSRQINAGRE